MQQMVQKTQNEEGLVAWWMMGDSKWGEGGGCEGFGRSQSLGTWECGDGTKIPGPKEGRAGATMIRSRNMGMGGRHKNEILGQKMELRSHQDQIPGQGNEGAAPKLILHCRFWDTRHLV